MQLLRRSCWSLGWWLVVIALGGCDDIQRDDTPRQRPLEAVREPQPAAIEPRAETVAIAWLPDTVGRHRALFEAAGRTHAIDPELLAIVALVESGGWTAAKSGSGARGLMQVMPTTGAIIAAERGLEEHDTAKLNEPAYNIDFGAWYLGRQLRAFASDDFATTVEHAAGAYNGGPTHYRRFLADEVTLSAQTQRYRRWVGGMWRERRAVRSETYRAWLEAGGDRLVWAARQEMEAAD